MFKHYIPFLYEILVLKYEIKLILPAFLFSPCKDRVGMRRVCSHPYTFDL